jgi:glycine hydroxymethyltransferase
LAVYNAVLKPGDKILAMYLPDGGHLSHGWEYKGKKITLVSKIWNVDFYHVDPTTEVFDYDQIEKQAKEFKPQLLISGGTAYPREIDYQKMGKIARSVNAYYLADVSHEAGLIAGGVNASPFPYADFVTMTTHKTLRGPRGALVFAKCEHMEVLDASIFPGIQGGPHLHSIAGIAIVLEKTKKEEFKKYAEKTVKNAKTFADSLIKKGFHVVSGGTDKHLVLVDLRNKGTNGWFIALALEEVGIITNKNTIPGETASPYYPSGVRFGTQALTVRGMREAEMVQIADFINDVVNHIGPRVIPDNIDERKVLLRAYKEEINKDIFLKKLSDKVKKICKKYPIA